MISKWLKGQSNPRSMTVFWFCLFLCLCCLQLTKALEVGENYAIRPEDQAWLTSLFYIPSTPRVRKEYRMLSDVERNKFHGAIIKMKQDRTVVPNKYDLLTSLHARRPSRNSAHRGTGFLSWHRVYVLLVENALREQEPEVTIPYWDCTLDAVLNLPRETSLFSEDFMGNGDGHVTSGPFKDWTVQSGYLYRTVGALHAPLADRNITHMFKQDFIRNISYPLYGKDEENVFELIHNRVHHWIGGEMKSIETAADDPIFHPYHSFVSLVWEEFRSLQRQKGIDPETDWDDFYGQGRHHRYSPMGLGNLMASDGASNVFAKNIVFDKRPSCTKEAIECGSPYLYCNVTVEKCSPWTLREYHLIKNKTKNTNMTIQDVVQPYKDSKLKKGFMELEDTGFVLTDIAKKYLSEDVIDMFEEIEIKEPPKVPVETEVVDWNAIFGEEKDSHLHDQESVGYESENVEESVMNGSDHGHEDHEHKHNYHIVEGAGKSLRYKTPLELFVEEYWVYILGGLLIFRVFFAIFTRCMSDPCLCGSKRQKYQMDGIVNINFEEDSRLKPPEIDLQGNRPDNVYTVTVNGQGTCGKGTFVRFAKYNLGESDDVEERVKANGNVHGNYMDMNHASACLENSRGSPELFERIPTSNEDNETDDFDTSYNSIENENFDFIRAAIREAGEDYDDVGDLFDTYDNFMFEREQPPVCNGRTGEKIYGGTDDQKLDEGYVGYLPGVHM